MTNKERGFIKIKDGIKCLECETELLFKNMPCLCACGKEYLAEYRNTTLEGLRITNIREVDFFQI